MNQKKKEKYKEQLEKIAKHTGAYFTSDDIGVDGNDLERMYNDGLLVRLGRTRLHRVWRLKGGVMK